MRKVFINKWFILSVLLTVCLSAFSAFAISATQEDTIQPRSGSSCCRRPAAGDKGEMIWEAVSRQFSSIISIR